MAGKVFYLILLSSFLQFLVIDAISYEDDTTITLDEADALEKLRALVRPTLPHKYMEESIYLVKFLRAKNFDVIAAKEALLKHIDWRAENKIDDIDDEDWKNFQNDFSWNLVGEDKKGRPLVQVVLKSWKNVSRAMENGQGDRLTRWLYKYMEDATKLIRKSQSEGKKVTRFSIIGSAEGFNPTNFECPACLSMYIKNSEALDQQFPESIEKILIIDASEYYREFIGQILPSMPKNMAKAFKIYGTDRESWRKSLSKVIDDDQLLPAFGGTMRVE